MVDNLDAPLYVQRYQNIINQGIKSLLSSLLKELDQVTKLSSLRFREARLLQVLADVNAEFLLTSSKLSTPVVTLGTCCESFKEYKRLCTFTFTFQNILELDIIVME